MRLRDEHGRTWMLVQQQESWDCGVCCVAMVLRFIGRRTTRADLAAKIGVQSVWTIDLAHALLREGAHFEFYTVTVGADPEYASEEFYSSEFSTDSERVRTLFSQAPLLGLRVVQESVPLVRLRELFLERKAFACIVLIDQGCLLYTDVPANVSASVVQNCIGIMNGRQYQGHYVVLIGYNQEGDSFAVLDPGASSLLWLAAALLETGRKRRGTDEDLIVFYEE